ncbi:MAG: hypothetical protein HKN24_10245 [Acidimicrobiales bacterium]|nr:hypothetical protein [Acidimicrobiales bacterium]
MSDSNLDFSVRNVPDSWSIAAEDAPKPPEGPAITRSTVRRMPTGTRPDLVTGALSGIAMTVITGAAWYLNSVNAVFTSTPVVFVLSILLGALIAIAIRLGAGPAGPELRVAVGAALYVVAILSIAFAVSREQYTALNRRSPTFSQVEDLVTTFYLNDVSTVVAWILGMMVMAWTTFALRHRRR